MSYVNNSSKTKAFDSKLKTEGLNFFIFQMTLVRAHPIRLPITRLIKNFGMIILAVINMDYRGTGNHLKMTAVAVV